MTVLERSRKARYWRTTELIMSSICIINLILRGPSSTTDGKTQNPHLNKQTASIVESDHPLIESPADTFPPAHTRAQAQQKPAPL